MTHKITVAHSPDADDIFMYYAIKFGWIDTNKNSFENVALDIETLNEEALKGTYDITAISFALYPFISEDYALLKTAVSFGDGYGPKLIKKRGKKLKRNFKVALSGKYTTNAMLFRIKYPEARVKYMNFLDIEKSVLDDEVDAGVLIHESILTYDDSLECETTLWDIWLEFTKKELPLPLGGMALRRSMPILRAIECEEILIKAVKVAENNSKVLSKMLMERDLIRVDEDKLKEYLSLYANKNSIKLSDKQYEAIEKLYEIGYNARYYNRAINVKDYTIPHSYKEIRLEE